MSTEQTILNQQNMINNLLVENQNLRDRYNILVGENQSLRSIRYNGGFDDRRSGGGFGGERRPAASDRFLPELGVPVLLADLRSLCYAVLWSKHR